MEEEPLRVCVCVCVCVCEGGRGGINKPLTQNIKEWKKGLRNWRKGLRNWRKGLRNWRGLTRSTGPGRAIGQVHWSRSGYWTLCCHILSNCTHCHILHSAGA